MSDIIELEREFITVAFDVPQEYRSRVQRQWERKLNGLPNQYAHDLSQAIQMGYVEKARKAAEQALKWNSKRYHVSSDRSKVSLTVVSLVQAAAKMGMSADDIKVGLERAVKDDDDLARIIERVTT